MAEIHGAVGAFYIARRWCLYFDGTGADNVDVADHADLDVGASGSFTVTAWVRLPANGNDVPIVDRDLASGTGWRFYINVLGQAVMEIASGGGGPWSSTSVAAIDDDAWHFICGARDGSDGKLYTWIDGVADPVGGAAGSTLTLTNATNLTIGNVEAGGANLDGVYIGETHFTSDLMTDAEILALYNGGDGIWQTDDADTAALWQMREGTGATVHDQGDGNHDGTITGAAWASHAITVVGEALGGPGTISGTVANPNIDQLVLTDAGGSTYDFEYTPAGDYIRTGASLGNLSATYDYYIVSEGGGFHSWTLDTEVDILDKTVFGNAWKRKLAALKGWKGSASRFWIHSGPTYNLGERMIVKFYFNEAGADRIEAWGILSKFNPEVPHDEMIQDVIEWTGDHKIGVEYT